MKTLPIIEQHFHGGYGVDFNKADADDIVLLGEKLRQLGICGFFPTLVTDSIENTKNQISVIKKASEECPLILGIHLEGIFLQDYLKLMCHFYKKPLDFLELLLL